MDAPIHGLKAPTSIYEVGGRRFETLSHGFGEAIAEAYASGRRPRCMCLVEGLEMYVAHLGDRFIVKRMPNTGSHHSPDCPSYERPAEFSGLWQVLGSAISEDLATGETTLKLDFPLSKNPGRSTVPRSGGESDSVATDGTKLSLRGLLHYLWDQAELTRWQPGFAGKRSWATVRRHLLQSAEHMIACGQALQTRLYIPELFSVEQRDAINARRLARWTHAAASPDRPQQLMLLIAEVKEIMPARYGYKAVVKHVPDQTFVMDEQLYQRLGRRFETELALWGACDALHMVMIATFGVSVSGVPTVLQLSLMPVTSQWLPVENTFALQLVERLVRDQRSFAKCLCYNSPADATQVSAVLTDVAESPTLLVIGTDANAHKAGVIQTATQRTCGSDVWRWQVALEAMPQLPPRATWL